MISTYVAAPFTMKDYAGQVRDECVAAGIRVTSRWIDFVGDSSDPAVLQREALHDWEDIIKADVFFLLNEQKRGHETSGKAVETGIALEAGKTIFMVGEPSNVFHHLGHVLKYASVEDAIQAILSLESGV